MLKERLREKQKKVQQVLCLYNVFFIIFHSYFKYIKKIIVIKISSHMVKFNLVL